MVNNNNFILDAGKIKIYDSDIMKTPNYVFEWYKRMNLCKEIHNAICTEDREFKCTREAHEYWELYKDDEFAKNFFVFNNLREELYKRNPGMESRDWQKIAEYMGVTPFYPSVMINISPNWKGSFGKNDLTDKLMIKNFCKVIDKYLNESIGPTKRFTKWKYCIECGSEGNFLHAHIVAEINNKLLKSMKTHFSKNNHKQQLMKHWDNVFKGHQGLLKGKFAIQRNLINSKELLDDKLSYLYECNKCEGHKNSRDLNLVFGDF